MTANEFAALAEAAGKSRIGHALMTVANGILVAWTGSRVVGAGVRLLREQAAFSPERRVRVIGSVIGTASLSYWMLLSIIPPYTATGLPRSYFLALAMVAWLVAGNADTVARAWSRSRVARMLRWLVT